MGLAGEEGDGVEPEAVASGKVVADVDVGEAGEARVTSDAEAAGAEAAGEEGVAGAAEGGTEDLGGGEEDAVFVGEGAEGSGMGGQGAGPFPAMVSCGCAGWWNDGGGGRKDGNRGGE